MFTGNQSFFVQLDALFIVMPASGSSYRLSFGVDGRGALLLAAVGGLGFFLAPPPVAADLLLCGFHRL